jgi:hypothetical protein
MEGLLKQRRHIELGLVSQSKGCQCQSQLGAVLSLGLLGLLSSYLDRLGRFQYLLVLQCKKAKGLLKHTHIQHWLHREQGELQQLHKNQGRSLTRHC